MNKEDEHEARGAGGHVADDGRLGYGGSQTPCNADQQAVERSDEEDEVSDVTIPYDTRTAGGGTTSSCSGHCPCHGDGETAKE